MKKCPKCGESKDTDQFYVKSGKLGSYCKPCELEKSRKWRKDNPEKWRESQKKSKSRPESKERHRIEAGKYYWENREVVLEKQKTRKKRNLEFYRKKWRDCYHKNKEKWRESRREYKRNNKDKVLFHCHLRRARKLAASGNCTLNQLKARFDYHGNRCYYCGKGGKMTMEHRIPLSRGGANWPANIVPACVSCNCSKGGKTETEFLNWRKRDGIN